MTPKMHNGHMKQPGSIKNMTKEPKMTIEYTYYFGTVNII